MDLHDKPRRKLRETHRDSRLSTTYEPLGFVLSEIEFLHSEIPRVIAALVANNPKFNTDPRAEFLFSGWQALEKKRAQAIRDYRCEGDGLFLATWVQYIPIEALIDSLRRISIEIIKAEGGGAAERELNVDDLWARLSDFNQNLVELYGKLSRSSSAERVEGLFSRLAEQTEREAIQLSWRMRIE